MLGLGPQIANDIDLNLSKISCLGGFIMKAENEIKRMRGIQMLAIRNHV